jgi:hypothetical protein
VLRGVYNYYCMAYNVSDRMRRIKWVLETSLTKTLAHKHRVSVPCIYRKYGAEILGLKAIRVVVPRPDKEPLVATFGGIPFKRVPGGMVVVDFRSEVAWFAPVNRRTEVVQRLVMGKCELCGAEGVATQVHHIRKLADLNRPGRRPKAEWERIMSARKRKTLVVCEECHKAIHGGRYDGRKL